MSIFAYGQTGSGKTWTMEGDRACPAQWGIIPRSVDLIFERCARLGEQGWATELRVEMLEIHNECIRDLLSARGGGGGSGASAASARAASAAASAAASLDLRTCPKTGAVRVEGLTSAPVRSAEDVHALIARASAARATGATRMNERSSRSHMVFTLRIAASRAGSRESRAGTLHLVDLAGSERLDKSGVGEGGAGGGGGGGGAGSTSSSSGGGNKMLTETININSSLLALGACVSALQARAPHVPYKNSKLTQLLSEALGGKDARTLILCTLNPLHANASESLSTLRFAANCTAVAKK